MKISVITPSRLAPNPTSRYDGGRLWLDRSLMSVRRQTVFGQHDWEFVVGLDPGHPPVPERFSDVKFVVGQGGQASAVNAAVAASTGDVLAFLEDDDLWYPEKMGVQLPLLADATADLVTCNSRVIDVHGNYIGINDFAGPSGWVMRRSTWNHVGPMDMTFKWHVDTEWLGRANAERVQRIHMVDSGVFPIDASKRPWLVNIARHSAIDASDSPDPLTARLDNEQGGMRKIASDPVAKAESEEEHRRMHAAFGEYPW